MQLRIELEQLSDEPSMETQYLRVLAENRQKIAMMTERQPGNNHRKRVHLTCENPDVQFSGHHESVSKRRCLKDGLPAPFPHRYGFAVLQPYVQPNASPVVPSIAMSL